MSNPDNGNKKSKTQMKFPEANFIFLFWVYNYVFLEIPVVTFPGGKLTVNWVYAPQGIYILSQECHIIYPVW